MPPRAVFRYEVPVDDDWHTIELSGPILHVAARRPDVVEVWAQTGAGLTSARTFRVFGTGQPLPQGVRLTHRGTALAGDGSLVWHLMEGGTSHDPAEPHAAIAQAAVRARRDRLKLAAAIAAACPQPHRYVQHRDRRPPWCAACRYTADGERIDNKEAQG